MTCLNIECLPFIAHQQYKHGWYVHVCITSQLQFITNLHTQVLLSASLYIEQYYSYTSLLYKLFEFMNLVAPLLQDSPQT